MRKTSLRELLERKRIVVLPGCYDAYTAKIIEKAGFEALSITGYGTSVSVLGRPDVGLTTMSEVVTHARNIASAVEIPVLADADTGYGNAINVMRTVREFERAGVAGIHIEDQESPKRCGFLKGKRVIPMGEMVGKVRAAVDAREDPDFVIEARTDAYPLYGIEEAIKRSNAYAEAGADAILFAPAPPSVEEIKQLAKSIKAPLAISNTVFAVSGVDYTVKEIEEMGVRVLHFPLTAAELVGRAVMDLMLELKSKGTIRAFADRMLTFEEFSDLVDLPRFREYEREYLPKEEIETMYERKYYQKMH